jgi:formate dehydrogenase subunit gamma
MSIRAAQKRWDPDVAANIISGYAGVAGGLLPALHELQGSFGFVPRPAIPMLAKSFNVSEAEIYGVASFYHDFRLEAPLGRHVLKLCRAEACQAVGCDALAAFVKDRLQVDWGGTSADGRWTLEPVFCLGLCACGPSALVDGKPLARLDRSAVQTLMDAAR